MKQSGGRGRGTSCLTAMTEIKASTQEHLDIETITDNLVVLKNGNVVAVLKTTAVNFDLLSEREQDAMVEAYGALLNSLSFPIQILVRSKRLNIKSYLENLQERKKKQKDERIRNYINQYSDFIKDLTKKNDVLDKSFYVVIPYRNIQIKIENPIKKVLGNLSGKKKPETQKIDSKKLVERATPKLEPRIEHLSKQFARIGIQTKRLETEQIIRLLYEIYNK